MSKKNKKWSKKEILLIMNYRKAKIKYKIIADIFNVTINSIYKTIQRYKVDHKTVNTHSFLNTIEWFNKKFTNKIVYNKLNFNFILNKEVYSKVSILIILNKLLLKNNMKIINDNKFVRYKY